MAFKNTSVTLGEHFEAFIAERIAQGRFESKSEAVRAALRLLEEQEKKIDLLNQALIEGEQSGDAGELNIQAIKQKAREIAKTKPSRVQNSKKP